MKIIIILYIERPFTQLTCLNFSLEHCSNKQHYAGVMNQSLDPQTAGQLSFRLKSLFESARRFRNRRSQSRVRAIKPRDYPRECQLELQLTLEN